MNKDKMHRKVEILERAPVSVCNYLNLRILNFFAFFQDTQR